MTTHKNNIRAHAAFVAIAGILLAMQAGCTGPAAADPEAAAGKTEMPLVHVSATSDIDAGRYLVKIGGCNDCHTPGYVEQVMMTGKAMPESDWLQGGDVGFSGPWGVSYAPQDGRYTFDFSKVRMTFSETKVDAEIKAACERVHAAGRDFLAKHGAGFGAADPAVAIPVGLAVRDPDAMDHAGATEPVIARRVGFGGGIGAIAQVAASEAGRNFAVDAQVFQRHLFFHRFVDAGQERVRIGGSGQALAIEIGDLADAFGNGAADQGLYIARHVDAPWAEGWKRDYAAGACKADSECLR